MAAATRREFLISAAVLSAGCVMRRAARVDASAGAAVREPAVGQSWRYAKRDVVSGEMSGNVVDRVRGVGEAVEIESQSEPAPRTTKSPSWGDRWLQKYTRERSASGEPLPSEVQRPWGMVLVDPHWGQIQVFEKPIPLWPVELRAGWSTTVYTRYKTPDHQSSLPWQLTMHAHGWESLTVPAGRFHALRYTNLINFRSTDFSRTDSQRMEAIWFVPELGRWAARESSGTYFRLDSLADQQNYEGSYRWELLGST